MRPPSPLPPSPSPLFPSLPLYPRPFAFPLLSYLFPFLLCLLLLEMAVTSPSPAPQTTPYWQLHVWLFIFFYVLPVAKGGHTHTSHRNRIPLLPPVEVRCDLFACLFLSLVSHQGFGGQSRDTSVMDQRTSCMAPTSTKGTGVAKNYRAEDRRETPRCAATSCRCCDEWTASCIVRATVNGLEGRTREAGWKLRKERGRGIEVCRLSARGD